MTRRCEFIASSLSIVVAMAAPVRAAAQDALATTRASVAEAIRFDDPAPPVVHELAPMDAPQPSAYPDLTTIASPRPLAADAITEDWPGFFGPNRDGHSRETSLARGFDTNPPRLLWTMRRGDSYASPAIAGDRLIYTHRVEGELHVDCLDATTGRRFWRYTDLTKYRDRYISDHGPRSTPVISAGRVFVHSAEGVLVALELTTGRVIWKRDLAAEFDIAQGFFGVVASPIVHGDLLIQSVGGAAGPTVAAFDVATGRLVWGAGKDWGASCASPIIATIDGATRLFVLAGGDSRPPVGGLLTIDPADGHVFSQYAFRSRAYISVTGATPVIGDGRIFVTAAYNTGTAALALDADGAVRELWKTRRIGMEFSNPIYVDGHLYAIDGSSDRAGAIVCFDPVSGEVLSRTDFGWDETLYYRDKKQTVSLSIGQGSLLHLGDRTLCLGDNGHLLELELSPTGATELSRVSLFRANETWTPLAISHGLLYVCQNRVERFGRDPAPQRLLCFDIRGGGDD